MRKRDLLKDVYDGILNNDEADDLLSDYLETSEGAGEPRESLMLSPTEYSARASTANWSTIAKWRYEGWPDHCGICGGKIVPEDYGWESDSRGVEFGLQHINCRWERQGRKPIPED